MNVLTVIYFLAWLSVFVHYVRKHNNIKAYGTIVLSYVIYSFLSIIDYSTHAEKYDNITFFPFVYLFVLLIIALIPIKKYDDSGNLRLQRINPMVLYIVFSLFLISTLVVLPSAINRIQHAWETILASDDGASELYTEMHLRDSINANRNAGIFGFFNIVRYLLFEICVFCFFYYLTFPKRNKILIALLLGSFFLDILISFSNGGRTTSTMDAFTILMTYLIYHQFMSNDVKKAAKKFLILLGAIFLLMTLMVTVSRTINREGGAADGIVDYLGQGNLYFNQYAIHSAGERDGDRTCNVFKRILGFDNVPNSVTGVRMKHSNMKISDHNFTTFIGDFIIDFGPVVTVLIIVLFTLLFTYLTKTKGTKISIEQLLLIQLVADICMHGGMYLFYYSYSGNYILLMYIVFYYVFKLNRVNDVLLPKQIQK